MSLAPDLAAGPGQPLRAEWAPPAPVDPALTLGALRTGRLDPCHRRAADGAVWRSGLMASGPVTYRIRTGAGAVRAEAWGDGAAEMLAGLPDLLGASDRPETFVAGHPVLEAAHRRLAGLRVPRTGRLFEALVPAVLHQKISGRDASEAWGRLVRRHGRPAPGPLPPGTMMVPPAPSEWQHIPDWEWRRAGVEPRAVRVIRHASARAASLERSVDAALAASGPAGAYRVLETVAGVGRWTCAEIGHRAFGDADALSVGDYHIAPLTGWALAGRPLEVDEVEAFYERWRPHRYRVMRLLELTPSAWPPRRGARMSRPEHRYGPF